MIEINRRILRLRRPQAYVPKVNFRKFGAKNAFCRNLGALRAPVATSYASRNVLARVNMWYILTKMTPAMRTLPYEERLARTGLWTLEVRWVIGLI